MNRPSVKKSLSTAARKPKGSKPAVPVVSPAAAFTGKGAGVKVFETKATIALGTVATGTLSTFAKDRW